MNPWLLLGGVAFWLASIAGAFSYGQTTKEDSIEAQLARDEKVQQLASEAAASATANAIAQIKPRNVTIRQETEREIQTNTVYRECNHSPEQLQRLNEAITGKRPEPLGGGLVPRNSSAVGFQFRSYDEQASGSRRSISGVSISSPR